jgi:predicted peptidase
MKFLATVCALGLTLGVALPQTDLTITVQKPQQLKHTIKKTLRLNYLLFLESYEPKGTKRWPLMLFLHGAGERGTNLAKLTLHGPPKIVKNRADFPFILVSPQCPDGETWSNEVLLALLITSSINTKWTRTVFTSRG